MLRLVVGGRECFDCNRTSLDLNSKHGTTLLCCLAIMTLHRPDPVLILSNHNNQFWAVCLPLQTNRPGDAILTSGRKLNDDANRLQSSLGLTGRLIERLSVSKNCFTTLFGGLCSTKLGCDGRIGASS